jgi:DNA-binding IclR family transcriptional regulator
VASDIPDGPGYRTASYGGPVSAATPRGAAPAARQVLALVQALARAPGPVPAATLARDLGLPRSTTYQLLAELVRAGFAVHLPEERRYGLGVGAVEIGSAYMRQEPLARLARPVLARLVETVGHSAHLAVLHGREVLYVVEERAAGRPRLVTDVGVRLPAQLTASGRAVLAGLSAAQLRALFPDAGAFVERHCAGPRTPAELRRVLDRVRAAGHASEDGEVTPGQSSVAAAVHDHMGRPVAGAAVTFPSDQLDADARRQLARRVAAAAGELTRRIGGLAP